MGGLRLYLDKGAWPRKILKPFCFISSSPKSQIQIYTSTIVQIHFVPKVAALLLAMSCVLPRPTSDVDIFVFPVDPRQLPAKVEAALAKSKA